MKPIVQISLDLIDLDEALNTAALAVRAGVDWLEAGTPLILAEGLHGIRALRIWSSMSVQVPNQRTIWPAPSRIGMAEA